ncbi:TetR/AcrR family transcriptional regulator C-terminal domain-containing protein [Streptomyces viridosporus]|uniref:TetR/AcrR family transcriptional regulator C-terminal domain-containing protein n=1 Tax=Streptomyces viridosporus TaxID=67581 RepID=UPI0013596803|nr:TetR/AcrR family transcriptional regulator C-terminal domain-containing protein [Streptomyces viridosporus]
MASALADRSDTAKLAVPDPERAAVHFLRLTGGVISDRAYRGTLPMPEEERDEPIASGVRACLRGYERR